MQLLLLLLVFFGVALASQPSLFIWNSSGCPPSYDFCGSLTFCSFSATRFGYAQPGGSCSSPGPTIRVRPGFLYYMELLHGAEHTPTIPANLHTHGLHIGGDGNGDNVLRQAPSLGCRLGYRWNVSLDHMGGTHWYHAHVHKHAELQVGGGATGLLIVEDDDQASAPSHVSAWMNRELPLVIQRLGDREWASTDLPGNLVAGQWYRLRVLLNDPFLDSTRTLAFPQTCDVALAAVDGIWRRSVPVEMPTGVVHLSAATRADIGIRCGTTAQFTLDNHTVATMNVVAGTPDTASPYSFTPVRPGYLRDLSTVSAQDVLDIGDLSVGDKRINGASFSATQPTFVVPLGSIVQVDLKSSFDTQHPLHLHLYPMQVVESGGCGHFLEGEWYDTIPTREGIPCAVRFDTSTIGGRAILHCHTLKHEDAGAMGWINVEGGPPADTTNPQVDPWNCSGSTVHFLRTSWLLLMIAALFVCI